MDSSANPSPSPGRVTSQNSAGGEISCVVDKGRESYPAIGGRRVEQNGTECNPRFTAEDAENAEANKGTRPLTIRVVSLGPLRGTRQGMNYADNRPTCHGLPARAGTLSSYAALAENPTRVTRAGSPWHNCLALELFRSLNEERGADLVPLGSRANVHDLAEKKVSHELVLHIEAEPFSGFELPRCRHNEAPAREMMERGIHELARRRGEFQIYPNWDAPKAAVFHAQHRADTAK
jgi:hypothetical protein